MEIDRLRIIVCGLLGRNPVGGWHYLQHLLGLSQLGHDVYYHEDTWCWPYNPIEKTYTSDGSYSAKYIENFIKSYASELKEKWHYLHLHKKSYGMSRSKFDEIAKTADIFLNIGGANILYDKLSQRCMKVFLDTDPGYNQIVLSERPDWSENVDRWYSSVFAHDKHFTYGENIHSPDCLIPKLDIVWKTTHPPVVLDLWEAIYHNRPSQHTPWTTIMTWNDFKGKLYYQGQEYKSKGAEFEKIIRLPQHLKYPLKVAVGGKEAPLERLAEYGWNVVDGPTISLTPNRYQNFLAESKGEISTAKHVYVAMRTGWFSERSVCYLAAGRPVVTQETGFSKVLPSGKGLLSFTTMEEATDAIHEVEANYDRHSKAARNIAEDYFDSRKVLLHLIGCAMNTPKVSKT